MYILIDFEATCWQKDTPEGKRKTNRRENEIIEIGAVLVSDDFSIIKDFDIFVKPTLNPILSDFCKQLTSIEQDDVDKAEVFSDAWETFEDQIKLQLLLSNINIKIKDLIFCSWGHYDYRQLNRDCLRNEMAVPFTKHYSIKHEFAKRHNIKPCGILKALSMLNMQFEGNHHRAIDDIKNIAKVFIKEWKLTGFDSN